MIQAVGYIRRSTDRQDESLDQQRAKLHAYAQSKGWTLVEVFVDDAISGSEMSRPGLQSLLDRITTDKNIATVLAWDRNRLARPKDPIDGMMLERQIMSAGKRIIYASTGTEADRSFVSGLLGYVEHHQNGDYLRKLSRDTMRGIVSRVQRGQWPGGPIPFGYDRLILDSSGTPRRIVRDVMDGSQDVLDARTGQVLERVPHGRPHKKQDHEICTLTLSEDTRVRAVRKMFIDYARGVPTRRLRDNLNAAGLRTSRGSVFTVQTIVPMLENPAYTGQCVYNRRTLSKWHRHIDGQSIERMDEGVERRPESDWIVTHDAWPALIDRETFDQAQAHRRDSREHHRHTVGRAIKAGYLLSHVFVCGMCCGKMIGQTTTNTKGYRTRYYICGTNHKGDKGRCPKRYTVPADLVDRHVLDLIRTDLQRLRDDDKLHQYVQAELQRLTGGQSDAREQLQRRLAELDQKLAKVRDHLLALDPDTARSLGFYDQARDLSQQRSEIEVELSHARVDNPSLPGLDELKPRIAAAFEQMQLVMNQGTIEEKRELISLYLHRIEADKDCSQVLISLYPALFSQKIAGAGFEPATSGL